MTTISNHVAHVTRAYLAGGRISLTDIPFLSPSAVVTSPTAMHAVEVDGCPVYRGARGDGLNKAISMAHVHKRMDATNYVTIRQFDYGK